MAKSPFIHFEQKYVWRAGWLVNDEEYGEEVGLWLGQAPQLEPEDGAEREEWETYLVDQALKVAGTECDNDGFFWETESQCKKALKLAREAMKFERPVPDWAQKAIAAGFKPPKGWKP
jgi:hypothetical protein